MVTTVPSIILDDRAFGQFIDQACSELNRALDVYYPFVGDNDICEAITAFHLAFALKQVGFCIYPLIPIIGSSGGCSEHIDFIAIHVPAKTIVVVEAKRLIKVDQARSWGKDWIRLQSYNLPCDFGLIPEGLASFVFLIGTTWSESYRSWWESDATRPAAPAGVRNVSDWHDLKSALDKACLVRAVNLPLESRHWKDKVYVLFAVIQMPAGIWRGSAERHQPA